MTNAFLAIVPQYSLMGFNQAKSILPSGPGFAIENLAKEGIFLCSPKAKAENLPSCCQAVGTERIGPFV